MADKDDDEDWTDDDNPAHQDIPASRRKGARRFIDNEAAESDCEDEGADGTGGGAGKKRAREKKPKEPLVWQSIRAAIAIASGGAGDSVLLKIDYTIYDPNNHKCTTREVKGAAPAGMFPFRAPWMTYIIQPTPACPAPPGITRAHLEAVPLTRENFRIACVVATAAETRRLDIAHVLDELKKRYPRDTVKSLDPVMQRIYKQRALIPIDALRGVDDFCKLSHPILIARAWELWGRSLRPKEYYMLLYAFQSDPALGDVIPRARLSDDAAVARLWSALSRSSERLALVFTLDELFHLGPGIAPSLFAPHERRGPFLSEDERELYKTWTSLIRAPWISEGVVSPVFDAAMQPLLDANVIVLADGGRVVPTYLRNDYGALFALAALPHVSIRDSGSGTCGMTDALMELRNMCTTDNVEMPAAAALVVLECTRRRAVRPDAAPGLAHVQYDDFFLDPNQLRAKQAIIVRDAHHLSRQQLLQLTKIPHSVRIIISGLPTTRPMQLERMLERFETPAVGRAAYLDNVFAYMLERIQLLCATRPPAPAIDKRDLPTGARSWTDALRDMEDGGRNCPVLCDTWETCERARRDALRTWYSREEQGQYLIGEWVVDREGCRARIKSLYREESGGSRTYMRSVACDDPRNEYSLLFALDYDTELRRFRAGGGPPEFRKLAIATAAEQRFMPEEVVILIIGSASEHPYYDYAAASALARRKLIVLTRPDHRNLPEAGPETETSLIKKHF